LLFVEIKLNLQLELDEITLAQMQNSAIKGISHTISGSMNHRQFENNLQTRCSLLEEIIEDFDCSRHELL